MAPHSSTLAWKIPWTEEPGRLQSMGLGRVGHDWTTSLSLFTFLHWRGKWQPTPVFLPGESQGRGSLVGCCLRGRTESDTTEATLQQQQQQQPILYSKLGAFHSPSTVLPSATHTHTGDLQFALCICESASIFVVCTSSLCFLDPRLSDVIQYYFCLTSFTWHNAL